MYAIGFGRVGAAALPFLGRSAHWPFLSPRTGDPLKLVKGDVKSAQYAAWHGLGLGVVAEGTITILVKLKNARGVRPRQGFRMSAETTANRSPIPVTTRTCKTSRRNDA